MKIYSQRRNQLITQGYGVENTNPTILSWYKSLGMLGHNGFDISFKSGEPIYYNCDLDGTVWKVCNDVNLGIGVTIITIQNDKIYRHRYWHGVQGSIKVQVGQKVLSGDLLLLADSTGQSTGNHLHYDIAELDKDYNTLNKDNGYLGCIDPDPFFVDQYIQDYVMSRGFNHKFYTDLKMGDKNDEVKLLQKILQIWGYFPATQECTGYYGELTRQAVSQFQWRNKVANSIILSWNKGKLVSTMTRNKLNELLNK